MTYRLTVRFCPADDGPSTVGADVLRTALPAVEAAIAAICQASDDERSPALTSVEFADPVMHLSLDGADATPIERLVAHLAAGGGPLPHQSARYIRELQYAMPKGVPAVELTHGGCTATDAQRPSRRGRGHLGRWVQRAAQAPPSGRQTVRVAD